MYKLVEGVGINDADYTVKTQKELPRENGKRRRTLTWICPFYQVWKNMLHRCYSEQYKLSYTTYIGCSVCEEWLTFSNFKAWMEQQDWEGKHLDKDLLVYKNKVYSPATCCFVDQRVNNFMVKNDKRRGEYPLGVSKSRNKYESQCWNDTTKKQRLGRYTTEQEAHKAWQKAKISIAIEILKYSEGSVKLGIERVINKIQHDFDNDLITEDF